MDFRSIFNSFPIPFACWTSPLHSPFPTGVSQPLEDRVYVLFILIFIYSYFHATVAGLICHNIDCMTLGQNIHYLALYLAWKIPWAEEPGRLQSMGSLRVGHNWATSLSLFTFMHWKRKWQPTPVFLPGESQGRGSLVGCRLWGRAGSDTTEAI